MACEILLVWTPRWSFSGGEKWAHLIYSGSAFFDLHPLLCQPSQEFKQSTKNQVKAKPLSLELLQGEQTQAQSLKNPKSSKLMYKEIERKEKYVMIT